MNWNYEKGNSTDQQHVEAEYQSTGFEPIDNTYKNYSGHQAIAQASSAMAGTILPALEINASAYASTPRTEQVRKSPYENPPAETQKSTADFLLAAPLPFKTEKNADAAQSARKLTDSMINPEPSAQKQTEDNVREAIRDYAKDKSIPLSKRKQDLADLEKLWNDKDISRDFRLKMMDAIMPYLRGQSDYPMDLFHNYKDKHRFRR